MYICKYTHTISVSLSSQDFGFHQTSCAITGYIIYLCLSPTQMTLFDTAGMERFEGTLPPTYFRNAFSVIFVYAINNSDSISSIPSWADSVSVQHIGDQGKHIIKALVGNKSDLEDEEREVNAMRAKETAQKSEIEQAMVFEVSAKTGEGVEEMYAAIARAFKTRSKKSDAAASGGSFPQEQPKQKKQCCN